LSFGGYGLALAALALVVFGAYDSYPKKVQFIKTCCKKKEKEISRNFKAIF